MNSPALSHLEIAATVWSIRASLICLVIVLFWKLNGRRDSNSMPPLVVRGIWLIGSLFSVGHALAAMDFYHQWSHAAAMADTAEQTNDVIGMPLGAGLYFNYLFVVIWLIDAIWWIGRPVSYEARSSWIDWSVYGFLIFIAINGAIVFETGNVRWFGIVALLALGWMLLNRWQHRGHL